MNLLNNEVTQPSKFRTKNWVKINDDDCGSIKTSIWWSQSLWDYTDSYILVKGTITVFGQGADATAIVTNRNSRWIFKNFSQFTDL